MRTLFSLQGHRILVDGGFLETKGSLARMPRRAANGTQGTALLVRSFADSVTGSNRHAEGALGVNGRAKDTVEFPSSDTLIDFDDSPASGVTDFELEDTTEEEDPATESLAADGAVSRDESAQQMPTKPLAREQGRKKPTFYTAPPTGKYFFTLQAPLHVTDSEAIGRDLPQPSGSYGSVSATQRPPKVAVHGARGSIPKQESVSGEVKLERVYR